MRWLFRPVSTLLVAPILFELVVLYLRTTTKGDAGDLLANLTRLGQTYAAFTLPALGLMLLILLPADLALRRTGLGLLTIIVSPTLAAAVVLVLGRITSDAHVQQWASAFALFVCYGLVWGLTIRDPSTVMED